MSSLTAPFMGIRGSVLPPGIQRSFVCGRERTINALKDGAKNFGNKIIVIAQRQVEENDPSSFKDFFDCGTLCEIESYNEYPDQSAKVILVGIELVKISDLQINDQQCLASYIKVQNKKNTGSFENFKCELQTEFDLNCLLVSLYHQDEKSGIDATQLVRLNSEMKKIQADLETACIS